MKTIFITILCVLMIGCKSKDKGVPKLGYMSADCVCSDTLGSEVRMKWFMGIIPLRRTKYLPLFWTLKDFFSVTVPTGLWKNGRIIAGQHLNWKISMDFWVTVYRILYLRFITVSGFQLNIIRLLPGDIVYLNHYGMIAKR